MRNVVVILLTVILFYNCSTTKSQQSTSPNESADALFELFNSKKASADLKFGSISICDTCTIDGEIQYYPKQLLKNDTLHVRVIFNKFGIADSLLNDLNFTSMNNPEFSNAKKIHGPDIYMQQNYNTKSSSYQFILEYAVIPLDTGLVVIAPQQFKRSDNRLFTTKVLTVAVH